MAYLGFVLNLKAKKVKYFVIAIIYRYLNVAKASSF